MKNQLLLIALIATILMVCVPASAEDVNSLIATLKYDQYAQNQADAAFALGDTGDAKAIDPLVVALQIGRTADIRANAASSLGNFKDDRALNSLFAALGTDKSPDVRVAAIWSLDRLADQSAVEPLIRAMNDPDALVRGVAAGTLSRLDGPRSIPYLTTMLQKDSSIENRYTAATALGETKDPNAVDPLIMALSDPTVDVRMGAADALGMIGDPRALPALNKSLTDPDESVRKFASNAIKEINAPEESPLPATAGVVALVVGALLIRVKRRTTRC